MKLFLITLKYGVKDTGKSKEHISGLQKKILVKTTYLIAAIPVEKSLKKPLKPKNQVKAQKQKKYPLPPPNPKKRALGYTWQN